MDRSLSCHVSGMDMESMMAGMGGDKPGMDDLGDDSDDEDLPDLE